MIKHMVVAAALVLGLASAAAAHGTSEPACNPIVSVCTTAEYGIDNWVTTYYDPYDNTLNTLNSDGTLTSVPFDAVSNTGSEDNGYDSGTNSPTFYNPYAAWFLPENGTANQF